MDLFNKDHLRELATTSGEPCVSMYMPTFRFEAEMDQNPIRLKNLLRDAARKLVDQGYSEEEVDALCAPARDLLDQTSFWRDQSDGLALFATPDTLYTYRLPVHFEELVTTGERFHLKPLFPIIASNNQFFLLALSQNNVKLFQGTHYAISEIHVEEIPTSLTEALFYDDPERSIQEHTGNRAGERRDSIRHGHGGANVDDDRARPKDELRRFFRAVDESVSGALQEESTPMLLAGVEYYLPIYRDVNSYPDLVDDAIVAGNPEHLSMKELHSSAWETIEPRFLEAQGDSIDRYGQMQGAADGLASSELKEIVPASIFSRIDTLFVPIGEHVWGRYDRETNQVEMHDEQQPGDEDLLDLAAVHTYLNGGTVHALRRENMPVESALAATFRYKADVAATEA